MSETTLIEIMEISFQLSIYLIPKISDDGKSLIRADPKVIHVQYTVLHVVLIESPNVLRRS